MNVGQLLADSALRFPERPAVTWGDRSLSYRELARRTNALARGLAATGLSKGDRVGVLMRNRPEVLEAMFACFKAGYCIVPLNSRFTSEEVAFHVEDSRARAVLTDADGEPVARGAGCADVTIVVAGGAGPGAGVLDHDSLVAEHDPSPISVAVDRDDLDAPRGRC